MRKSGIGRKLRVVFEKSTRIPKIFQNPRIFQVNFTKMESLPNGNKTRKVFIVNLPITSSSKSVLLNFEKSSYFTSGHLRQIFHRKLRIFFEKYSYNFYAQSLATTPIKNYSEVTSGLFNTKNPKKKKYSCLLLWKDISLTVAMLVLPSINKEEIISSEGFLNQM